MLKIAKYVTLLVRAWSSGSSGPRVHEETHLNCAQFIKMSFESIDR